MTGRAHVHVKRELCYMITGAAMSTHSRAGVEKRLGGRIQRNSRRRSAAKHNAKNGAEMLKAERH